MTTAEIIILGLTNAATFLAGRKFKKAETREKMLDIEIKRDAYEQKRYQEVLDELVLIREQRKADAQIMNEMRQQISTLEKQIRELMAKNTILQTTR